MEKNNRTRRIEARVTEEEYQRYKKKADEKGMTMTSLIRNSLENNITINLDTSVYRDLVIEVRRIGININQILKRIHYNEYFTQADMEMIKTNQEMIEEKLEEERKSIWETKKQLNNLTIQEAINLLGKK